MSSKIRNGPTQPYSERRKLDSPKELHPFLLRRGGDLQETSTYDLVGTPDLFGHVHLCSHPSHIFKCSVPPVVSLVRRHNTGPSTRSGSSFSGRCSGGMVSKVDLLTRITDVKKNQRVPSVEQCGTGSLELCGDVLFDAPRFGGPWYRTRILNPLHDSMSVIYAAPPLRPPQLIGIESQKDSPIA